ncbi:MAG: HAD superfamily hydrolase (TIGR01509 family) [Arcticibacterium sp.]|jgi:HAD superfamily hydrolase (TIGR01509 family)
MSITPNLVKALIFDMDGLLVDSEPCWHTAEKTVFGSIGLNISTAMCMETTGKPVADVIQYWYKKNPWPDPDFDKLETDLFREATAVIKKEAQLMPGVLVALDWAKSKHFKIGLASASPIDLIKMALKKFGIQNRFDFYHSAELEEFNKPHPAVYLTVAKNLGIPIENCLILEDSGNGVKGALASGAQVIAIPAKEEFYEEKFNSVHLKLSSMVALPSLFD